MKRLLLATSILALAAGGAFAQGMNNAPSDAPRSLSPSTGASSSSRTAPAVQGMSSTATTESPTQVMQAQQALKQKGLYTGPVDGKVGPETRSAISQFQKQNGLQQSAQLDEQTIDNLQGSGAGSRTRTPSNSAMPDSSPGSKNNPAGNASGSGFSPQQNNDKDGDSDTK
jgi:peptidoglycan hydrolase-like protein with peptidoglycan-binding domain